jgi:4-alpha-glucanotransferase
LHNLLTDRRAGVLLHPTSLPYTGTAGGLGPEAFHFIDFIKKCGFSVWQTLPLGPTHCDRSPYQCLSVHAGNTDLISREDLVSRGWLDAAAAGASDSLAQARHGFESRAETLEKQAFTDFKLLHAAWLDDYALYQAIRQSHGGKSWFEWPAPLRNRRRSELSRIRRSHAATIEQVCFEQYVFFLQWQAVRDHAHRQGIALFGDMPIYVAADSADIWAGRELFSTDAEGKLDFVAGVPPDYFSANGQRWGNPLYRWDRIQADDFRWWLDRFRTQLLLFDIIRLDHFRGFEKYWEVPSSEATAINGRWVEAPGDALFGRMRETFGDLPLVAEDLGTITTEVDALRRRFDLPGMKILQFAFDDGPDNPYLPHNHVPQSVVYTGTHDNNTTLGWYQERDEHARHKVNEYLGNPSEDMPWPLIRMALASVARLAILPMQDILALGNGHRMNLPGTTENNWNWKFDWSQVASDLAARLQRMIHLYGRYRH